MYSLKSVFKDDLIIIMLHMSCVDKISYKKKVCLVTTLKFDTKSLTVIINIVTTNSIRNDIN